MTRSAADYSPTPADSDPNTGNADELDAMFADDDLLDAAETPVGDDSHEKKKRTRTRRNAPEALPPNPLHQPLAPLAPLKGHVPEHLAGERLDKVLARLFPDFSRGRLQTWLDEGRVRVDGVVAKPRQAAAQDALIEVEPQHAPESLAFSAEPVPFEIVYEDSALVVINKPAGLVVHPGAGNWHGTLLNGLLHHYGEQAASLPRAGIVHRLDKETSGLMVVARTLQAQTDLVRQLQARTVKRRYVCLVWGNPPVSGTIDAPIGRDPRDRLRMGVVHGQAGKPARTHFTAVSAGRLGERSVAVLQCDLETGRTHQIRVHCRHIGHPLVGDPLYGGATRAAAAAAAESGGFTRQALHAWSLGLRHPETGEAMSWQAEAPEDMRVLAEKAGVDLEIGGDFADDSDMPHYGDDAYDAKDGRMSDDAETWEGGLQSNDAFDDEDDTQGPPDHGMQAAPKRELGPASDYDVNPEGNKRKRHAASRRKG